MKDVPALAADALRQVDAPSTFHCGDLHAFFRRLLGRGLHLFQVDSVSHAGLSAGFIIALLHVLHAKEQILWASQQISVADCGSIYGPGLIEHGIDPARLLLVEVPRASDVLWAVEEGLRSQAAGAVVGELAGEARALDLTATRRLALRSDAAGVPVYLSTVAREVGATAVRTRWRVSSSPSRPTDGPLLLGEPTWTLELLKNRSGPCGRAKVGFSPARGMFFTLPAAARPDRDKATFARSSGPGSGPVAPLVVPFNASLRHEDEADRR